MSEIGQVLNFLNRAQQDVGSGHNNVMAAREGLHSIAATFGQLGADDRAALASAATQSAEEALAALTSAIGAVEQTISAAAQAGGAG